MMANRIGGCFTVVSVATLPFLLAPMATTAQAAELIAIEKLGRAIFFDTSLSTPGNKQGCVSCHEPKKGWAFPDPKVNATTVVAPGAAPHRQGFVKPPASAYMSLAPAFQSVPGFSIPGVGPILPPFAGGNFWNGRAEGCGATPGTKCPLNDKVGEVSESIGPETLPTGAPGNTYGKFLGPTADQALNPFPKGVEQNAGEKKTCQQVKTAKYKELYFEAYGEPINCQNAGVHTSFKRLAIALAAYQKSDDVVPFNSKRDQALDHEADKKFPLGEFTPEQNRGHDLFYGRAFCSVCHNGQPNVIEAIPTDLDGTSKFQVYTDYRYHHIGVPFNREIPGVGKGDKKGLADHVAGAAAAGTVGDGFFKTPTLRNVALGLSANGRGKAFTHNGYFKTLKGLVHFYNTRDLLPDCATAIPKIANPTMDEALDAGCWPKPEFDNGLEAGAGTTPPPGVPDFIGNLGLSDDEEDDIVAYLKTLSDTTIASAP